MTPTQIEALTAAYETGNAVNPAKLYKNGAHLRMLNKLVAADLLTTTYTITEKGKKMIGVQPTPAPAPTGPFRIKSSGVQDGKAWARFHGEPIANRELAERRLADLNARTARVYGKQPAPFAFELV